MATTLTIKINFGSSRPFLRFRYEDGDWQLSNTFEVESGEGPYRFSAIDSLGCIARITIKEDDLDFPDGNGTLTISKTVTSGGASDNATFFQFSVDGPVSFENVLVSADEPMVLENLPFGTYTVKENDPPSGYLNSDESKTVTLSDSNKSDGTAFVNEIDPDGVDTGPGSITVNKVVTNEEPTFSDATFRVNVIGPNIYYGQKVTIATPLVLSDLPVGTYNIEEVGLPDGFFLNAVTPDNPELTTGNPDWTVKVFNTFGKENTGPGSMTINKKVLKTKDSVTTDVGDFSVLDTGLAVDDSLHGSLSGVSMDLLEAGSPVNIHLSGEESWEQGGMTQGWGSIIQDHEGNLRVYYGLREINGVVGNHAPCLSKSTDGGATFQKVRQNLNPTIINSSQSNIIKIPSPDGVSESKIINLSVYYDPYGKKSERYKATHSWNGVDGVWASASEDGLTFGEPVKIMTPNIGDGAYTGMFYDLETKKYVMYGRGRFSDHAPAEGPPKPHGTRRYVVRAESLNWNDTPWGTIDVVSLDPATEWGYDDSADEESFWQEVSDSCGDKWEPVSGGMVRPNIYRGNAKGYKGYDIGIFPVYFQDDNRVSYNRPERTTGPMYPVFAYKKNGTWQFPDNDKSFIDLSIYERTETNPCHSAAGVEEVGQVNSAMFFDKHNGKFFTAALNRLPTHYEGGSLTDFDPDKMRMDVFSMREDGFARITGTGTWTTPNFELNELTASIILNSVGQVDVEILDSGGSVITNFSKADFSTITSDNVDNACEWTGTLANLVGQTIALKFYLDNASVYSYSFLAGDVDQNDELFTGDLQGEITIEGLQFSANDPAEIQNLPLGTYRFEEDEKSGWLLKSIDPLETTLTEDEPEGEVLVTNEYGTEDPEFDDETFYITSQETGTGAEAWTHKCQGNPIDGVTVLAGYQHANGFQFTDRPSGSVKLRNGNVISYALMGTDNGSGFNELFLFDENLNLITQESIPAFYFFASDPIRQLMVDYDDSVYMSIGDEDGAGGTDPDNWTNARYLKIAKYSADLQTKYYETAGVVADPTGVNRIRTGQGANVTKNYIVIVHQQAFVAGSKAEFYNKVTGDHVKTELFSHDWGACTVENYTDGRFIISGDDTGGVNHSYLFDENGNLLQDDFTIPLVGTVATNRTAETLEDGTAVFSRENAAANQSRLVHVDANYNEIWSSTSFGSQNPGDIYRTTDPNILILLTRTASNNSGQLHRINLTAQTVELIDTFSSTDPVIRPSSNTALAMPVENWQVQGGGPPPPTGTASITVNKTIQDGVAADDDVEFTVNVYGPVNLLTRTVTANTPLVLEDLPFGEYKIFEETSYPGQYEEVSITPDTFTLKDGDASQTVEIVNRKMDSDEEFVTGTLKIEDILSAEPPTKAYTEIEIQDTGAEPASGSITVKYKGVNVTLNYNEFMSKTQVALALAGEIENDGSIELDATVPSGSILRLTEKVAGEIGNSSQTGETVSVSFTNGTHISTPTDIFVLDGGSGPGPDFIELYYPWQGTIDPNTPKVSILYSEADAPVTVANAIVSAVNAASINISAAATDTTITFTEKRAGPAQAGNVIRIITNGQTVQITPSNGKITMS